MEKPKNPPDEAKRLDSKYNRKAHWSRAWLVGMLLCCLFAAESAIMYLLPFFPAMPGWAESFVDAGILALVMFPIVYVFVFRFMAREMVALDAERQLAQTQSRKRLAAQIAASKAFAQATTWRQGLEGVLRGVGTAMGWSAAGAWEVDHEAGELYCSDFWSAGGASTLFTRESRNSRFKRGEGLPGLAWSAAKPYWIPDMTVSVDSRRAASAKDGGLRRGLAFPIMLEGEVEGVLEFFDSSPAEANPELMEFCSSIGSQMGEFLRRRRSETALLKAMKDGADIQAALDSSAIVATTDAAGRITRVNALFTKISGYTSEELIGKTHKIVNSGHHPRGYFKEMWETISSGQIWRGEICNRNKRGGIYWVATTITPFLDVSGKPFQYIAIRHDITSRKISEIRAEEAGARLQAVLDNATQVSIIATDTTGAITIFNKGAENLLGYTSAEIIGKSPALIHVREEAESRGKLLSMEYGRPIEGFDAFVEPARQGGFDSREWTCVRKNGERFPVRLTVTALRDSSGNINGFLGIGVDITESRSAREELAKARDAAIDLAKAKAEFLANMSHEIRTPMNAVIGMTGLLMDSELTVQQREFGETIRNAGESLLAIIGDILDFSKMEAGSMPLEILDFDPRLIAEEVAMLFAARAQDKGLEIAALVDEGLPPRLRGDAGRLRQILSNFISNAIKFTEKGEVVLRVRKMSDDGGAVRVRFEAKDSGIGVSAEGQAKLFRAFSQADASTTRKYGGTGLGLAIAKKLVELMNGQIGIDSVPGKGSIFWFELTLEKGEDVPLASQPEVEGVRVLIVDDSPTNREILLHQTSSWRMRPTAVNGGEAALAALRAGVAEKDPYVLGLFDMQMPLMDGAELAATIKSEPALAGLKMILLSSMSRTLTREDLRKLGFSGALTKPVRKSSLFDSISDVLSEKPSSGGPASSLKGRPGPVMAPPAVKHAAWAGLRILIAEDNVINQKVAVLQLQKLGCKADTVANGREAVEAIFTIHYDLVLMDCQMPEMDGFEATKTIRARQKDGARKTVIIAMTANALEGDREKCLSAGMDDYISKPVRIEILAATIARWYPSVDPTALEGLRELGDASEIAELVEVFITNAEDRIAAMRAAVQNGDAASLEREAHSLKGAAGNLGVIGVQGLAARLEVQGREKTLKGAASLVEALQAELSDAAGPLRAGAGLKI